MQHVKGFEKHSDANLRVLAQWSGRIGYNARLEMKARKADRACKGLVVKSLQTGKVTRLGVSDEDQ